MTGVTNKFPGYEYVLGDDKKYHNMYRGVDLGRGGYVYAVPGMYSNVAILDVASMHPHSAIALDIFDEYTANFKDLLDTRMLIKHKEYDKAKELFGGKLAPYLDDPEQAKGLSYALKIAINSVYGLTSASFENPFMDPRNVNNIVALRGALFMKTLQDEVESRGFQAIHIKTDSIKIPNATPEIISFCMDFAKKYSYTFEHEATYDRICLVNDAVYIAQYPNGEWTATGTQFQVPYVFKKLFSKEQVLFDDLCETKSVTTSLYLDLNEDLHEEDHNYSFVGKVGRFCPMVDGAGGGLLLRTTNTGGYASATGTKGYRWLESSVVKERGMHDSIDMRYYDRLVTGAIKSISEYGDFEQFVSND